jgi:hypothetical protein
MTLYSETEFATRVLKDLGLIDADETPSASDLAWAKETANAEIALLNAINLPIWNGSEMAIPIEYLTTLSRRVGIAIEPSFGLASLTESQLAMREAERYLTMMANPRALSPKTLRSNDATGGRRPFDFASGR